MSSTVLSTKILAPAQKELVLNAGLGLVEYDAITVEYHDFKADDIFDHYIFTSQNGVKSFLKQKSNFKCSGSSAFCVGEKTKILLQENNIKVVEMAENASKLAHIIVKNHKNESFLFLSGNLRRADLPTALKKHGVRFEEIVVYRTILIPKAYNRTFEGILCFSPSGVESHAQQNDMKNSVVFCIGETTAMTAKKYASTIKIANKSTVENVIVQAVNYFKN